MDVVDSVCDTLQRVLGRDAEELRILIDQPGRVTLEGVVEDEVTHTRVLNAVTDTAEVQGVVDHLEVKPDIGAEAEPKETEFRDEKDTRAVASTGFQLIP
jgi:hypothetical protein